MKSGLAIIVLFAVLALSNGQLIPNCFGIPNGYSFNNPSVPTGYYLCQNNVPIPMQCITGFVYCENLSACCVATPAPVTFPITIPTIPTIPITTPTTTLATTPTTTPATTPTTTPTTTPATTPTTVAITTPTTTLPTTTVSPVNCSNVPNGSLYPSPSNCSGYYMCVNGVAKAGTCLGRFAFNAAAGTCSTTTTCS